MNKKIVKILTKGRYGDWLKNLSKWIGGIGVLYALYNQVYDVIYGIQCEQFYKIPSEYFHKNLDVDVFRLLIFILLFWLILIFPKYISAKDESSKFDVWAKRFDGIAGGIFITYINLCILFNVAVRWSYINYMVLILGVIIFFLGTGMFIGAAQTSYKWIKYIFTVIIFVQCCVLCFGAYSTVFQDIEDKRNYEIVSVENKEFVILSKKDDKALVVPFSVEYNELGKVMILHNDEYSFSDKYKGVFRFEHLECAPQMRVK